VLLEAFLSLAILSLVQLTRVPILLQREILFEALPQDFELVDVMLDLNRLFIREHTGLQEEQVLHSREGVRIFPEALDY